MIKLHQKLSQELCNDEQLLRAANYKNAVNQLLTWCIVIFFTLYVWNQSIFQFNLYWTTHTVSHLLIVLSEIATVAAMMMGCFSKVSKELFYDFLSYCIICLIFAVLGVFYNEGKLLFYIKAMIAAVAMFWIIRDRRLLYKFLMFNFWLGFILILLNSMTIFHWSGIIELPHKEVVRIGGVRDFSQAHLDPYYFGIFGLTENHIHPDSLNKISARLQGWSSEPLHWSYFVFLTISFASLLLYVKKKRQSRLFLIAAISLICVHLYFIQSTTALISVLAILLSVTAYWLLKKTNHKKEFSIKILFFLVVLLPGLIIPFLLALVPNVQDYFFQEQFFDEGRNWEGKLTFLSMGKNLFFRFFPSSQLINTPSHNLILEKYMQGGFFLLIPLLYFFYRLLKTVINEGSLWLVTAAITFIVAQTLTVPTQSFYPTASMWFLTIMATAFFNRNKSV